MKADRFGGLAEQARHAAGWHTAMKGEGRCDGCVHGGNELAHKPTGPCAVLGYTTKANATCDRHQRDPKLRAAAAEVLADLPDPVRVENLLVLPWQSAEYVKAFSGANLATLRSALIKTSDPHKIESLTTLIRAAEARSTQEEEAPMTRDEVIDTLITDSMTSLVWRKTLDKAPADVVLAAMARATDAGQLQRAAALRGHAAALGVPPEQLNLASYPDAEPAEPRELEALPSPRAMIEATNLPAAAPIKFMPAETVGADDERNARRIVERMGRQKLAAVISKLLTVTDLIELREIKESGIYKGFSHIGEDGKSQPVTTWEEYCRLIEGKSVEAIDLDLKNFETLGAEFFESARRIGIGPGKMRELRKLPPDIQEKAQTAADEGNKAALLEIIELQAEERRKDREQAAKEKADLEKQLASKDADHKASRKLLDQTSQELREAKEAEIRRKLGTPNQADRDRTTATLNTSADAVKSRLLASFRKECLAVLDAHDGESAEFGRVLVAQALGIIMAAARQVGGDLGVVPASDAQTAFEQGAMAPGEKAWKIAQAELAAGAEG